MGLNLEMWSVVIGLMELGCAMTWNHDEQFVEGDFPYFPYNNRMNAFADVGDSLTDARVRSNEFSGFKAAVNRKNVLKKRKSLYTFNKDTNKLIDGTKVDLDELEVLKSAPSKKLTHRERPNPSVETGSLNSLGQGLKSPHSKITDKLNSAGSENSKKKLNGTKNVDSDEKDTLNSVHFKKQNSAKLATLKKPAAAENSKSHESKKQNSSEQEPNSAESEEPVSVEPENMKHLIETAKVDSDEAAQSKKPEPAKLATLKSAKVRAGPEKPNSAGFEKELPSGYDKRKLKTKMLSKNHQKATEMKMSKSKVRSPSIYEQMFNERRFRRNSGLEVSSARRSRSSIGSDSAQELWTHGIPRDMSRRKFAREDKPNDKTRKITLVAPYETNYTGGGFRSVNPSSWLAKEIERFIRRKDHRWLDFMKNTGMDVKKYSGVVSNNKKQNADTDTKKTPSVKSLHDISASNVPNEAEKFNTDSLISRIDSLLVDLNLFRSSVKNGWTDINSIKKTRDSENGQKLTNNDVMYRRKHRLQRGIRSSRISALRRPPFSTNSDSVEDDLRDLRKNLVLYRNRIPEEEMRALKDMKLHIKVYVEKDKENDWQ